MGLNLPLGACDGLRSFIMAPLGLPYNYYRSRYSKMSVFPLTRPTLVIFLSQSAFDSYLDKGMHGAAS